METVALLFFNVGVEAGQLLFVAAVLALLGAVARLARQRADGPFGLAARVARPAAYAIGIPAAFWLVQRSVGFLA